MTAPAPAPMGPLMRRRLGLPAPEPEKPPAHRDPRPEWLRRSSFRKWNETRLP